MAPSVKHGGHIHTLSIPAAAAGSAADTVAAQYIYNAFARGGSAPNAPGLPYDPAVESLQDCSFTAYTTLTGQATNYVSLRLTHSSSTATASTVKNRIEVTFSSTGVVATAGVPYNLFVASGGSVAGGTLTVVTGVAIPSYWTFVPGDVITLDRLSNNSTGLATPAISVTFLIGEKGS